VVERIQTKGNIGEWSELYALALLLINGGGNAADDKQEAIKDLYFKVLQVIVSAQDATGEMLYEISKEKVTIFMNSKLLNTVPTREIQKCVDIFYKDLTSGTGKKTFALTSGQALMTLLHKRTISAGSGERATDLQLVLEDPDTLGPTPRFGFSIKSQLGSAATLLNSSGSTNIVYEIVKKSSSGHSGIPDISNSPSSHYQNLQAIYSAGYILKFCDYQNIIFAQNLSYIDSLMPERLAKVLLESYLYGESRNFSIISERVFPLDSPDSTQPIFKLKEFLGAVSMGLRPSKIWKGNPSKFKGLLVIKEDGSMIFYYLNSRLNFEEYLYRNVKFDTPSTSRHKYGFVYSEGERNYIKLNLQIRFKK